MTFQEFVNRTDYKPATDEEWRKIVHEYYKFDWENKDMFCRRWLIEHGLYHKISQIARARAIELKI